MFPREAMSTAEVLLRHAAAALPQPTPGRSSSSSGSRLTALLWDQVQQSKFLQQLPGLLDSQVSVLQARMAAGKPSASTSDTLAASLVSTALNLFGAMDDLQPSFLASHAAVPGSRHAAGPRVPAARQHSAAKAGPAGVDGAAAGGIL